MPLIIVRYYRRRIRLPRAGAVFVTASLDRCRNDNVIKYDCEIARNKMSNRLYVQRCITHQVVEQKKKKYFISSVYDIYAL